MNMLTIILPILCFAALLERDNFRESFLNSAIAIGFFIAISTEFLSLLHSLAYTPMVICWSLYLIALLVWKYHNKPNTQKVANPEMSVFQIILLVLLICIVGITGITAIISAPNNFDSLTYHLPRIMHWIQNMSVEHYPTHIDRQLVMAPFSEFVIMHLQILSGSDRFANCVQWFSMVGSAVGVSLIARALKGSLNSQIVSAAVAISIPMGLLQSTSTQNDYAVTFWLVCLTYFIIKAKECSDAKHAILVGICLALAIFTKGTAYLVAAPFMMVYLWHLVVRGMKTATAGLLIISLAILLVNGGHYARNFKIYGNPISPGTGNDIISTRVDVTSVISCVTKNIGTQMATGMPTDMMLTALTNTVHNAIGVDVNDTDLTVGSDFVILPSNHEDYAPNPLHMVLLLFAAPTLVLRRKKYSRETILFATATMLSFIVLSIGIKWNPWISRYFLPVFVISAPFLGLLYDEKLRMFLNSCVVALLVLSFIVITFNQMRPLVGPKSVFTTNRIDQYFILKPQLEQIFIVKANTIKEQSISNIGILGQNGNFWEYILWVLLKDNGVNYRIEHVDVKNRSGAIKLNGFSAYFPVRF
jgi:4-amino-4-deoxy-L-arabinose transferase-like glycosyltransferase